MVAIRRDYAVLPRDRGLHADRHRLLPVVQVAKPPDQLRLVERVGGDLHPPHPRHVAEEGEELLGGGLHGAGGRLDVVACEGERRLHGDRIRGGGGEEARGGEGLEQAQRTAS